ncbi:hypothetical protein ACJMK2_009433 [Sinanodonta woodiana]|uniref:G-protein coupled receptors family 1 profile domain-containing protein n=1 Tax=Sinanodonta woodiana TaxID=1069815 RepID=A0ABD3VC84_SINWO
MSVAEEDYASDPTFYAMMLVICVFSVFMNILVLIVVLKDRKHRISIDLYIFNLSLCDILHAGIVLPLHFKIAAENKEEFDGGDVECKLVMFLPLIAVMASISTMVAIAVDRYQVIVKNSLLKIQRAFWTIAGIWVFSVIVSSPQLYEYNIYYTSMENSTAFTKECGSHAVVKNFETIYAGCVFLIAYAIPLAILLFGYTCIIIYIWKTSSNLRRQHEVRQVVNSIGFCNPLSKKKIRVLKMLITIAVVFILLWTPYFVTFAMEEITGKDNTGSYGGWLNIVRTTMTTLSTISNPMIYFVFSQDFRRSVAKMICCCKTLNNVVYPTLA